MKIHLDTNDINKLEQRKRTAFINSLSGFKSLNLIATINNKNITNVAVFNSVFHLGADPALIGFIMRPDSVERHTLSNIKENEYYTINHINSTIFEKAHQTSARYGSEISEFDAVGLTPEFKNNIKAPFVKESVIQIGLKLVEIVPIKINNTSMIIGKIVDVYFPEEFWLENGTLDIEKSGTISGSSLNGYHSTKLIKRLQYAKP